MIPFLLALTMMLIWLPATVVALQWMPMRGSGRIAFCAGLGGVVGFLFASLFLMELFRWTGHLMPAVAVALVWLLSAGAWMLGRKRSRLAGNAEFRKSIDADGPLGWPGRLVVGVLLVLIAVRLASLLPDVVLRPLFAWDAWTVWAYTARAWAEVGAVFELLPPDRWLSAGAGEFVRDNLQPYPELVSSMFLWHVSLAGEWTGIGSGVFWGLALIWIALVLYGTLRWSGLGVVWALGAVYAFVSLPIVNAHVALHGYADLWVGSVLACFAGLLILSERSGNKWLVLVAALLLLFLPALKLEGPYWLACGLAAIPFALFRIGLRWAFGLALLTLAGLWSAWWVDLDLVAMITGGRLAIDPSTIGSGLQGALRHAFVWSDWHLLVHGSLVALLALLIRPQWGRKSPALVAFCLAAVVLIWGALPMTDAGDFMTTGTLFSRIFLHAAPAMILLIILTMHAFGGSSDRVGSRADSGDRGRDLFGPAVAQPNRNG